MNKTSYILLFFSCILFISCSSNKKREEYQFLRPASVEFHKQDSVTILNDVDTYLSYFKNKDYASCANMLHKIQNDTIKPLNQEEKDRFVNTMTILDIKDVKFNYLTLRSELNNQIEVVALVDPNGDINADKGVTHFYLNPILRDGKWYLTLLDTKAEGVEGTK